MHIHGTSAIHAPSFHHAVAVPHRICTADEAAAEGYTPALPRTGTEVAGIVSVILKSVGDDDTAESMSSFVDEVLVRRQVVIHLIEEAKARGHRAYWNVDMDAVRQKALQLPEEGVPPEVMRMMPLDDSLAAAPAGTDYVNQRICTVS